MTTYPPASPTIEGDVQTIHRLLANPALVARRVQQLSRFRYIADALLPERLTVAGGAIVYEDGDTPFTDEHPRAVAPGGRYPQTGSSEPGANVAKTTKWGEEQPITDEAISRLRMSPVNRALRRLVNSNVRHVDSIGMSVIASAVASSTPASVTWATAGASAEQILLDVLTAKARAAQRELGIELDTVALDDMTFAYVKAKFIAAGYLPREGANALTTGADIIPNVEGLRWLPTSHGLEGTAIVADTDLLGGMADENLGSPGYVRATEAGTAPVEVKTRRDDQGDKDQWIVRARRVTVPVVLEPYAAELITGVRA